MDLGRYQVQNGRTFDIYGETRGGKEGAGKKADDTSKLGDSHDGGELAAARGKSLCLSPISKSVSPRDGPAAGHVGRQYRQLDNFVILRR